MAFDSPDGGGLSDVLWAGNCWIPHHGPGVKGLRIHFILTDAQIYVFMVDTFWTECLFTFPHYSVYPSEPDEENREDIECSTSEDDDDDDDNMEQMLAADEAASASAIVASRLAATSYSATERPSMLQGISW